MSDDQESTSSDISLQLSKEVARAAHANIKTHFPEARPTTVVVMPKAQAASASGTSPATTAAPEVKRKRGRPRKVQAAPAREGVDNNQTTAPTSTVKKDQPRGEPSSGEPTTKLQRTASPGTSSQARSERDSASPELGAVHRERSGSKGRENVRAVSPSVHAMRTRSSSQERQSSTPPARPGPSSSPTAAARKPQIVVRPASGSREVSPSAAGRFVKPMAVHMKPHVRQSSGFEEEDEDEEQQPEEMEQDNEEQMEEDGPADDGSDFEATGAVKDAAADAEEGVQKSTEPASLVAEDLDEDEVMLVEDEEALVGLQNTIANMVAASSGRTAEKRTPEPNRKSPMEGSSSMYAASSDSDWQRQYAAEKKARETAERQRDHYKRELAKETAARQKDQANVLKLIRERTDILRRLNEVSASRPKMPQPAPVSTAQSASAPKSTAEVTTMTTAPPETRSAVTQTPAIAKPKRPPAKKDASTQMVARARNSFGGNLLRDETLAHAPKQKRAVSVQCAADTRAKATDTCDLPQPPAPPVPFANGPVVPREPYPVLDNSMDAQQAQADDDDDEFGDMTIAEFWEIVKAECNGRSLEETYGRQE